MICIFNAKYLFLVVITLLVSVNYGLVTRHQLNTVVHYLGEDYYLKDGCPLPDCDDTEPGCFKRQIELKKKFNGCYSGKAGKEMGCLDIGRGITIPVFAKFCSRLCYYDGDEAKQNEIIYCPHEGKKADAVDRAFRAEQARKDPSLTSTTTTERIVENPDRTLGHSTLIVPENEDISRRRTFGSFNRFDRPSRRRTTRRPSLFDPNSRTPRGQNSQTGLEKSIHELVQEGFFDNPNNFASAPAKTTETSSEVPLSTTSAPFTTPSLSTKATDVSEENAKNGPPLADASLLLDSDDGSNDWSLKTTSKVTSQ